jgi:hypothetical protein
VKPTVDRPIILVSDVETIIASGSHISLVETVEFAGCQDASCAPPPHGTGGSRSSALPSGKSASPRIDRTAEGVRSGRKDKLGEHSSLDHFSQKDQEKMVKDFVAVTGLAHLKTPDQVISFLEEETYRQVMAAKELDPDLTARHWYVAAHTEADSLSQLAGASSTAVGAAVLAVTSPQTPWHDNVGMAREIVRLHGEGNKIAPESLKAAYSDANNKEMAKIRSSMSEDEFLKKFGEHTWRTVDPVIGGAIFKSHLQFVGGNSVDQVLKKGGNGDFDEVIRGKIVAKSGESGWKALEILNASLAHGEGQEFYNTLSLYLGDGSKVRSFYNNINDPSSSDYVTIDTHAAAGMTGFPGGSGTAFVRGVMSPGSTTLGMSRSYPLYQEALNRVAARTGLLPREVQSVTWVRQRDVEWPDTVKSKYTMATTSKGPIVSHLQYQMAVSARGPEGVKQGLAYRDKIRELLLERVGATSKRSKEINEEISNLNMSLGLTDEELRSTRKFAAPPDVLSAEKKAGITVP